MTKQKRSPIKSGRLSRLIVTAKAHALFTLSALMLTGAICGDTVKLTPNCAQSQIRAKESFLQTSESVSRMSWSNIARLFKPSDLTQDLEILEILMMMKTSENGKSLIKRFEGLSTVAYNCPGGYCTIGYGHKVPKNRLKKTRITEGEADLIFESDVQRFERELINALNADEITINQNQFDALISFSFNLGAGVLVNSSIWRNLKAGDLNAAADCFLKFVFAGGQKLKGLERRRAAERELFLAA